MFCRNETYDVIFSISTRYQDSRTCRDLGTHAFVVSAKVKRRLMDIERGAVGSVYSSVARTFIAPGYDIVAWLNLHIVHHDCVFITSSSCFMITCVCESA